MFNLFSGKRLAPARSHLHRRTFPQETKTRPAAPKIIFFLSKKTVQGHKDLIFCTYVGAFCAILHPNPCKFLASNPVTFAR